MVKRLVLFPTLILSILMFAKVVFVSEVFDFANDFIESFRNIAINLERPKQNSDINSQDYKKSYIAMMKEDRLSIIQNNIAKVAVSKYVNSNNELMKETANGAVLVFNMFINYHQQRIDLIETMLTSNKEEDFQEGKYLVEISKQSALNDEAWDFLNKICVLFAHSLVSSEENQNVSHLLLTSDERKELTILLDEIFGDKIKFIDKNLTKFEFCGATIRKVITSDLKSANKI